MELTPDASLFVQVAIFLVLWISLKRLLFDPVLAVLDARRERTVGAMTAADQARASAEGTRDEYEVALRETRARLAREADAARQAAQNEQAQAIAAARASANEEMSRFRETLSRQVEEARGKLAAEAQTIASTMLTRVSGGSAR